ncbi:hypothetical protein ASPZODRAFT_137192 [Penicilliopsis zonata CBS 506.65]|uniref:Invertebrate defensins family profile domain-containing protein n=1 Tax=Penicilliopsis zonata CBS 506.65 TaxID=1073090 RepID=A0A1L9S619_9EURO|nr:hypothetical protein ASPZODRAFT_137192 [Penicilliopsis zonata CBS 506.65]OJJ42570.1 hypothetical protein ASPZODRAFT_137192 [Penicilliopsis zonata CBS 506.65]
MKITSLSIALVLSLATVVAASPAAAKTCHKKHCPKEILKTCCKSTDGEGYCAGGYCYCGIACL